MADIPNLNQEYGQNRRPVQPRPPVQPPIHRPYVPERESTNWGAVIGIIIMIIVVIIAVPRIYQFVAEQNRETPVNRTIPQNYHVIFEDNFNDNHNGWSICNDDSHMSKITGGKYIFENKKEKTWILHSMPIEINQYRDFRIEVTIRKIKGSDEYGYGILWGEHEKENHFYTFEIAGHGCAWYSKIYNGQWQRILDCNRSDQINQNNSTNVLSIQKSGNVVTFFINGSSIGEAQFERFFGNKLGFIIKHDTRIAIEHLIITQAS